MSRQNELVPGKRRKELTKKKKTKFLGDPKITDDVCRAQATHRGSFQKPKFLQCHVDWAQE